MLIVNVFARVNHFALGEKNAQALAARGQQAPRLFQNYRKTPGTLQDWHYCCFAVLPGAGNEPAAGPQHGWMD